MEPCQVVNTYRAHYKTDTTLTCWVRDASGKRDLTTATLTVPIYPYGSNHELATATATSTVVGKVSVAIPTSLTTARLNPGLYRFAINANGVTVYDGLLEVV